MNPVTYDILTQRVKRMGTLPAMPTILTTLCEASSVRASQVDVHRCWKIPWKKRARRPGDLSHPGRLSDCSSMQPPEPFLACIAL